MDSSEPTATQGRRRVIALLLVTAVLLFPLVGWLYHSANYALEHKNATDWMANHEAKQSLERAAVLIVGAPCLGTLVFGMGGALSGRRPGVSAATGALIGTLAVWITVIVAFYIALRNARFEF